MSETITARDVEDRLAQAQKHANEAISFRTDMREWSERLDIRDSWQRVRDRMRAGVDPIIAVLERE